MFFFATKQDKPAITIIGKNSVSLTYLANRKLQFLVSGFYKQLSNGKQSPCKEIIWLPIKIDNFASTYAILSRGKLTHFNFKQVRTMQLCSKILLPDCTTSTRNPAIMRSVQYFSCSNLRILKCRNLPFSLVKYSDLKRMNNSVLDFALCAKTETFKTLATVERLKVKGTSFYLRF